MSRLNLVLLLVVLVSGAYMVRSAYDARRLFTELDRARAEAQRLEADLQRLQAERHAQATNLRVEQVARDRLQMRLVGPSITEMVAPARAVASGARP